MDFIKRCYALIQKRLYKKSGAILSYHRVAKCPDGFRGPHEYTVQPAQFEDQIEQLSQSYRILSIDQLFARLTKPGYSVPDRSLVITFDDGFIDTFQNALPILERHDVPATVFVSTNFLESDIPVEFTLFRLIRTLDEITIPFFDNPRNIRIPHADQKKELYHSLKNWLKYKSMEKRERFTDQLSSVNATEAHDREQDPLMLSWSMCQVLSEHQLITIGSHGMNHVPQALWKSFEQKQREITQSKNVLERRLDVDVSYFSYPYGEYERGAEQYLAKSEYKGAVTTGDRFVRESHQKNRYCVPRIVMQQSSLSKPRERHMLDQLL